LGGPSLFLTANLPVRLVTSVGFTDVVKDRTADDVGLADRRSPKINPQIKSFQRVSG
jgi:hypothetical protein